MARYSKHLPEGVLGDICWNAKFTGNEMVDDYYSTLVVDTNYA